VAALVLAGLPTAAAAEPGQLRVAHLSPDSPTVDIAVASVADPGTVIPLAGVGYGTVSAYRHLPAGTYTVSVRAAGDDPAVPPALSTTVEVSAGSARTVAAVGSFAALALAVLDDDLTPPAAGSARIRVLAAAAGASTVDVGVPGGPPLASGLSFGTTGGYADVPGGTTPLRIAPSGGSPQTVQVSLAAGSVYSLLILNRPDEGLEAQPVLDAASAAAVPPVGGVEAGAGGAAVGTPAARPAHWPSVAAGPRPTARVWPLRPLAAAAPLRLQVPAIGVDSPLSSLGVDPTGALLPPADFRRAGWFGAGAVPGEIGPAVIAGHVDSYRGPAVFFRLDELSPGDEVLVQRADGTTARFTVSRVGRYPKSAFPTAEVYGPTPDAQLRLITCGGAFDRSRRSYVDNVVVYARQTP